MIELWIIHFIQRSDCTDILLYWQLTWKWNTIWWRLSSWSLIFHLGGWRYCVIFHRLSFDMHCIGYPYGKWSQTNNMKKVLPALFAMFFFISWRRSSIHFEFIKYKLISNISVCSALWMLKLLFYRYFCSNNFLRLFIHFEMMTFSELYDLFAVVNDILSWG